MGIERIGGIGNCRQGNKSTQLRHCSVQLSDLGCPASLSWVLKLTVKNNKTVENEKARGATNQNTIPANTLVVSYPCRVLNLPGRNQSILFILSTSLELGSLNHCLWQEEAVPLSLQQARQGGRPLGQRKGHRVWCFHCRQGHSEGWLQKRKEWASLSERAGSHNPDRDLILLPLIACRFRTLLSKLRKVVRHVRPRMHCCYGVR